jgi:branched-chain amino acid transport system ATP-binding protein
MIDAILKVEDLTMRFGGLTAVNTLSFEAQRGHITAVIGPNGAGKTTAFNCITGFYKPTTGTVTILPPGAAPIRLDQLPGHAIARKGRVARTFQNIRLFGGMTLLENLMVAQHNKLQDATGFGVLAILGLGRYRAAEHAAIELAKHWLEQTNLIDRALWRATAAGDRARHVHRPAAAMSGRARRRPQPARIRRTQRPAAEDPRRRYLVAADRA